MANILIVEDSQTNLDILREILNDCGSCDTARSGLEAVEKFNHSLRVKEYYDLILLDIGLPGLSGMRILHKIRLSEQRAGISVGDGIPIIMVTSYKERFLEAYDKGCHDYILKPIDPDILLRKIHKYIQA